MVLSGPKLMDRLNRRNTEPAGNRGKWQHKRLEEELERMKEDHSAVTKYCE